MGKSYKSKRRKVLETRESLEWLKSQRKERITVTLDRVGYRTKEEYTDCVSWLAW